ncbi:MAG: nickel pincer cofactor biosynthesis protein LarB [Bacteroidetes bacterium]|nr:MAG: nickel pincer cofactor biosynthesis protein LarB [Bacteroidota bacterium]RLD96216.1 MAG: nickel pincer cofactor biosynthesis protein LarB [Bacteroidota bacterium]
MDKAEIIRLLELYSKGELKLEETAAKLSSGGLEEMGFATLDTDRHRRTGIPEVIYSEGKTAQQLAEIAGRLHARGIPILATRATREKYEAVLEQVPGAIYHELARAIVYQAEEKAIPEKYIAVVSAGTSDMPVSEEAAVTAEFLGSRVERIYDVGVAGIHRLFNRMDIISNAAVIIVVAGMEGALASVVGGLVDIPVIGVPCSAGYGANFGGVSALLAMLNSCAAGVSVVNIDNGFGAACQAYLIAK